VLPLLDMLIEAGVKGFQGFQPECGLTIERMSALKTRDGEPVLIFGPLAVTTELPVCTPAQIRAKVRSAIRLCRERGAGLCLFTGNTINPDVPLENILAMCEAVREAG
jgi:uroporphyrinogen-III decarboxylase